jgi:hypothetical protein
MRGDARSSRLEGYSGQTIHEMAWACGSNGPDTISSPNPLRLCKRPDTKRAGRRRNLVSHARSVLTGLPKLDMRIWAHTTQDKAEWNDLCSQWNRDTPEFIVDDPRKCPICSKCYRNLGTRITRTHAVSTEVFKCPIDGCGEVFKTKNARTIHLKNEHY